MKSVYFINTTGFLFRNWFTNTPIFPVGVSIKGDGADLLLQQPKFRESNAQGGTWRFSAVLKSTDADGDKVVETLIEEAIVLTIIPLTPQRIELHISCDIDLLKPYCRLLTGIITERWPDATWANRNLKSLYLARVRTEVIGEEAPNVEESLPAREPSPAGRPRLSANEWARHQVHELGRAPADVYDEWLQRRAAEGGQVLVNYLDSFKKALSYKKK